MSEVFTPLNEHRTKRLRIDRKRIEVLDGSLADIRILGYKATIKVGSIYYEVHQISCGLDNCNCDAYIKPIPKSQALLNKGISPLDIKVPEAVR